MNKLTKILFSVLTSVALYITFAGEFAITGGAKATYTIMGQDGTSGTHASGKGVGISNEFSLTTSGELDNDMTWSYAQDIDGATVQDDANVAIGTATVHSKFVYLSVHYQLSTVLITLLTA